MEVSVIIPVYNAAPFVTQAVHSALEQAETAEVLLIEDGSPDGALEICRGLAGQSGRVKLLRHPNGENRGAGASRNLGMKAAGYDYIAFLDADDVFLPGRFERSTEIFEADPGCDGVYEAIGMLVEDEQALERWKRANKSTQGLHSLSRVVPPEDLGRALIAGDCGSFSLDGLILRKRLITKIGLMDETMRLHQDSEFMVRAAIAGRLLPGRLDEPVSRWRVHGQNRISAPRSEEQKYRDRLRYRMTLFTWCKRNAYPAYLSLLMNQMLLDAISTRRFAPTPHPIIRRIQRVRHLLGWLARYPKMSVEPTFWAGLGKLR